jgi:hypothetical protein
MSELPFYWGCIAREEALLPRTLHVLDASERRGEENDRVGSEQERGQSKKGEEKERRETPAARLYALTRPPCGGGGVTKNTRRVQGHLAHEKTPASLRPP